MKKWLYKAVPLFPLALIPSLVYAQEASVDMGLKVVIAALPIIIGVILVVCLLQFNDD
ncbi:MAG: hypothetical protein GKR91_05590 [Pseudomonadales bacterium]|nr:hypothetical protein [Pseudomonadales bacterium]